MLKLKLQYFGHLMWSLFLTYWKRSWCWERLKAGGEGDNRGWDGWMASQTGWTWVWASSGSWWWTGRPGVLQSMGSQRVGHDWVTELNWLPFLPPGGLLDAGMSLVSPALESRFFTAEPPGKPQEVWQLSFILCPIFPVSFRKKFAVFLLIQSHLYSWLLWRWLIKFMIHTSPDSLIKWWFSHTLSCLMRTNFLVFCNTDKLELSISSSSGSFLLISSFNFPHSPHLLL